MGISEREHHINALEQFLHDYQEWGEDLELKETIKYAISSLKTDLKYDLLYEGEDVYTKADMVKVLTEIQLEIHELENPYPHDYDNLLPLAQHNAFYDAKSTIEDLVEQKINTLRGAEHE